MMITRRKLIGGLGLLIAAPAVIRVADLMPIKAVKNPLMYMSIDDTLWHITTRPTFGAQQIIKSDGEPMRAGDLAAGNIYVFDWSFYDPPQVFLKAT